MKKAVFILITIIAILLIIILLKNDSTYSSKEIEQLILKGVENFDDMSNVSFERQTTGAITKHYYKGNKMKISFIKSFKESANDSLTSIINLDEGKQYLINPQKNFIGIQKATTSDKGLQFELAKYIEENHEPNSKYIREYVYIKDEIIEGKDCIFVKEQRYNQESGKYIYRNIENTNMFNSYWIEKSTGFVIGFSPIKPDEDTAVPITIIRNITFGEVKDSDFDLPTDYIIYDNTH